MPNIDLQRVRLLSAWARDYFTSGLILDVGSAGAQDPFLLNAIRKDVSAKCELVGVDMNLMGLSGSMVIETCLPSEEIYTSYPSPIKPLTVV